MTTTKSKTATSSAARNAESVWSDEERAAMQDAAGERKAAAHRDPAAARADGERDVLAKIAELPEPDRSMAGRIHEIVTAAAPDLAPKTWYGSPAYARNGKIICFFQAASKFKTRYSTFGFQQDARLDDGAMWPVAFALTDLTADGEAQLAALVKKAAGV